jgi:hypothetical protein
MEREVGYAIGWLFVVSGVLAVPGGELLPTLRVQNHHRRAASWFRRPFEVDPENWTRGLVGVGAVPY